MGIGAAVATVGGNLLASRSQSRAADRATRAQTESADRAILEQRIAREELDEALQPFEQALGTNLLPQVQRLYGPSAAQNILADPVLQQLQADAQRRITAQQAAAGRLGTQETANELQNTFLRQGVGLLSQQRGDLLNAIRLGQNSAALSGAQGIASASNIGSLLTQQGSAASAGAIARGNIAAQNIGNLAQFGGGLLNYFGNQRNSFGASGWQGTYGI